VVRQAGTDKGILNIISEEAQGYYQGQKTVDAGAGMGQRLSSSQQTVLSAAPDVRRSPVSSS